MTTTAVEPTPEQRAWCIADVFRDRLIVDGCTQRFDDLTGRIATAIREAVAAERERCAVLVLRKQVPFHGLSPVQLREDLARAIREGEGP